VLPPSRSVLAPLPAPTRIRARDRCCSHRPSHLGKIVDGRIDLPWKADMSLEEIEHRHCTSCYSGVAAGC
jgi:hypothetical protein